MTARSVFIGLGANLGDCAANLDGALERLGRVESVRVVGRSSYYRTEPVGVGNQPEFLNGAAEIETAFTAAQLLVVLKKIEADMGRVPSERWGPRLIDLDILLCGDEVVQEPGLKVPHPEMHRRRFVLEPLAEIAPQAVHPVLGRSVEALLSELSGEVCRTL